MPRVRLTAGGRLALAVFGAALAGAPAFAAPPGPGRSVASGAGPADTEGRRRDEIDLLQRQDAAEALKKHFNLDVDWRTTPLDRLVDIRVRAAKAAELQQRLGVTIDWQRYSWIELEALRRTLISFEQYRDEHAAPAAAGSSRSASAAHPTGDDGLVSPTFK